jgi:hypothetical protein
MGESKSPFATVINGCLPLCVPFEKIGDAIWERMVSGQMRSRNLNNLYISYGFSRRKREPGLPGYRPPSLTSTMDRDNNYIKLVPIILDILDGLSSHLRMAYPSVAPNKLHNMLFANQMRTNYGALPNPNNIYEGVDVAILRHSNSSHSNLAPHCDVENDCSQGYTYISVVKSTFHHRQLGIVTISIIAYTRKGVGDWMKKLFNP